MPSTQDAVRDDALSALVNLEYPKAAAEKAITVGKSPDGEDAVFFDADGDGTLDIISSAEGSSRKIQVHWAPPVSSVPPMITAAIASSS